MVFMNTFKIAKEVFDEIYGSLSVPVVLLDKKARLINTNQSFAALTGVANGPQDRC